MPASPFTNVYGFLSDLHTFIVFLNAFRDWNTVSAAYKATSLSRSDVYRKVDSLLKQGLLISKEENGVKYYRLPSQKVKIVGFGEIDFTDAPVIHIYIDQYGKFLERVRRKDVEIVYVGGRRD